ncbi:MAG: class I tRNA ligase family protein, partial [Deltaproteobacteria bacterium]|nr:class I tRNA ligase family protein [Deltaproteobacteria bacterium]
TLDLSNLYLDVLKDRLYTFPAASPSRRSAQSACFSILDSLTRLMAPVLSFLAEEVWDHLPGAKAGSVHQALFPQGLERYLDEALAERYEKLLAIRSETTVALERARAEKKIGNALDALVYWRPPAGEEEFYAANLASLIELSLVSDGRLGEIDPAEAAAVQPSEKLSGLVVGVAVHGGPKCPRCWMRSETIGQDADHPQVCARCAGHLKEAAANQ